MADFEKKHPGIAQQELWKLFVRKAEEAELGRYFISAVGEVCAIGLDLSKDIVRFFPNFTLHDETHSANVCRWMWRLLGTRTKKLSVNEAALLLMAACCHDVGMAVSPAQEEQMRLRTYPGWDDYFRKNLSDAEEFDGTKTISDRMLRNFVRLHHHERVRENLVSLPWPQELTRRGIRQDTLVELCQSHGQPLDRNKLKNTAGKQDLLLCAVLLRLADMLDYDMVRAPEAIFRFHGLENPRNEEEARSAREYLQNRAGNFDEVIADHALGYNAVFEHPRQEQAVMDYLDWVKQELDHCGEELRQTASKWQSLQLPYRIDTENVERIGYEAGDFSMTMDQDRVIDLLTGENLYSDPGVFVRELLQNSIDAVLLRAKKDPKFPLEKGLVQIDSWRDAKTGDTWFRIRDNGTGMNRKIIKKHFLKVGNSYYTSEEFLYENRQGKPGSYTAISRFGIGILSCFMCDKDRTELKVATKRFDEGKKCGIRLDVTGLHGQYFLSSEEKHKDYVENFRKMPSPDSEDQGFREEPGTTICVRSNLLRMGETRSFREIVDEYVQFPEIRVTYNGPEGYFAYPTQQELMTIVTMLNGGNQVQPRRHRISDNLYQNLLEHYHLYEWEKSSDEENNSSARPELVFWFNSMSMLADSSQLSGAWIQMSIQNLATELKPTADSIQRKWLGNAQIVAEVKNISENGIYFRFEMKNAGAFQTKPAGIGRMDIGWSYWMPISECDFSEQELKVWELLWSAKNRTAVGNCVIAYNGVLAENGGKEFDKGRSCAVLLLRENFRPQVNMARNVITGFPLEAVCCMAMAGVAEQIPSETWRLATERELWGILDRHPAWAELMQKEVKPYRWGLTPVNALSLAHWKRKYQVSFNEWDFSMKPGELGNEQTADFPVGMFFAMRGTMLACTNRRSGIYYNRFHPFSRWLIEHRAELVERAPVVYDTMIKTMILTSNQEKIRDFLNTSLELLRKMEGNPFQVPADLILTEKDFK